jgi:zinc-binding alcohol dehydrogenase/oxidoreductase
VPFFIILSHMKALVMVSESGDLRYQDVPDPVSKAGREIIHLNCSALNRRDYWITKGRYPRIEVPVILGSDGSGVRENGERCLINPGLDWGDDNSVQSKEFRVLGLPDPGTFAERISLPSQNIFPVPEHLSDEEAAALPLAGVTAYRVLFTRCQLKPGSKILITGIGGGVATTVMQFALAIQAIVYVTSSKAGNIQRAVDMGVKGGVNYTDPGWEDELSQLVPEGFDVIIDSAGGPGFQKLISLATPGGRIGIYGGTSGQWENVSPQKIFWRQISILGSTMGSPGEFRAMLEFVNRHGIKPPVDSVYKLKDGAAAIAKLGQGGQFGKIILQH